MNDAANALRSGSRSAKLWGFLVLLLGLLAIGAPFVAGVSVVLMVGFVLIAAGVAKGLYALGSESFGKGVLRFAFALLAIVTGVLLVTRPGAGLAAITLFLAVWFIVDGAYAILAAFSWKPQPGWGWLLFSGIVSVVLGVMIWNRFPSSALWLVGVLVGIRLVFAGLTMMVIGSAARRVADVAASAE